MEESQKFNYEKYQIIIFLSEEMNDEASSEVNYECSETIFDCFNKKKFALFKMNLLKWLHIVNTEILYPNQITDLYHQNSL